ncbi:MAG: YbaY family lipoprotein [Phyllobacterium sp.]
MKRILGCVLVVILGVTLFMSFVDTKSVAAEKTIKGHIVYRERIALPPEATLNVQLADVSLADAAATVITETSIQPAGQSPIEFSLTFDPEKIVPGHSYAIQARIATGDTLWFVTDEQHQITPLDVTDPLSIRVTSIRQSASEIRQLGIADAKWLAEDINGGGVIDYAQTTLSIASDGEVQGSGGCNPYFSTATIKQNEISFTPVSTTYVQCPPALMDQERKFYEMLSHAKSYRIEGSKLYLIDTAGNEISRLALSS